MRETANLRDLLEHRYKRRIEIRVHSAEVQQYPVIADTTDNRWLKPSHRKQESLSREASYGVERPPNSAIGRLVRCLRR